MSRLRKIYVDLVDPSGNVAIVYVAWLRFSGIVHRYAGVEFFFHDGRREFVRARVPASQRARGVRDGFLLDTERGGLVLRLEPLHDSWSPAVGMGSDRFDWSVIAPRARVALDRAHNASRPLMAGLGYADFVELRRLPRRLDLRAVDWGRIHLSDRTVVFNIAHYRGGKKRYVVGLWRGDRFDFFEDDVVLKNAAGGKYLEAPDITFCLEPVRLLSEGTAVSRARFPNPAQWLAARVLSGPIYQKRWLSRVREGPGVSPSGLAIHEHIRFGRRQPDRADAEQGIEPVRDDG